MFGELLEHIYTRSHRNTTIFSFLSGFYIPRIIATTFQLPSISNNCQVICKPKFTLSLHLVDECGSLVKNHSKLHEVFKESLA